MPPRSRLPALVTLAVVLVVVAGVAVGTALAHHADTHLAAAPAPPPGPASASGGPDGTAPAPGRSGSTAAVGPADQIDFSTPRGAGRLRLLAHRWDRPSAHAGTARLRVRVEVVCTDGAIDYAPEYFSLFDAAGHLVEPAAVVGGPDALSFGRLGPGERVRGSLAFVVGRGDVTLVMGDDVSSVTALRLPG